MINTVYYNSHKSQWIPFFGYKSKSNDHIPFNNLPLYNKLYLYTSVYMSSNVINIRYIQF